MGSVSADLGEDVTSGLFSSDSTVGFSGETRDFLEKRLPRFPQKAGAEVFADIPEPIDEPLIVFVFGGVLWLEASPADICSGF